GAKQGAKQGASAAKAQPAKGKAVKAPGSGQPKLTSGSGTTTSSTQISDIQIVPYTGTDAEENLACRPQSTLNLFPDIIARVNSDNDPADGKPRLTFVLNEVAKILPAAFGCNDDALIFLPAQSSNIASIGGPEYLGNPVRRIRVKIFSPNPQQVVPFTFAFRLRFSQGLVELPKPRRKRGSIKVR
ncbi:MAG TPA: hypothetical protein VE775_08480, partial [Pyrinomonadaceae bacterium]|nr:hypothetical protein [Pyrinomonadaceae bacterium]